MTAGLLEASHDIRPPLYPASRTVCPHRHRCLCEPPPSEFLHHQEEEPPSGLAIGRRPEVGGKPAGLRTRTGAGEERGAG